MSSTEVAHAYRNLYRAALQATHYAIPARYIIKGIMRRSFRTPSETLDQERVTNTVNFLERARLDNGIENKIIKNLCHVRYWQHHARSDSKL